MKATLREWTARLLGAFGRGRTDGDIEQELQGHMAMAEEELRRQGLTPEAAAREARLQHGRSTQSIEIVRERRGIPPLSTFLLDLKLGVRMLRKHWALTLIGGLAMAATMTIGSAVFNLINGMLGSTVPLEEGDRVVIVQPFDPETQQQQSPTAQVFEYWRGQIHSLVDVGAFRDVERDITTGKGFAPAETIAEMSAAGFSLARIQPSMGRFLLPEDERSGAAPVLVIGYDAWQSTFGADPGIVGQQIQLDRVPHTVIGVMPRGFRFPLSHQYWTSLRAQPSDRVTVFARLAPGASMDRAQSELTAAGFGESESRAALRPFVRPYVVGLTGERSFGLAALLPFVLPLLLIPPCTNIGALIYARTVTRHGEFAVRTALGATSGRIVFQIFVEVLVLTSAAAALAIVLAPKLAQILSNMVVTYGQPFWMDFGVSYGTILFTAGLALVAAYITGVIPARRAAEHWQLASMNTLNRSSGPRLGKGWTAIVVAQVALAVAVAPTAAEFAWQELRPAILGPGFPVKEFLTARLDLTANAEPASATERFNALSAEVVRQLEAEPGVTAVTVSQFKPMEEENVTVEVESTGRAPQSVNFNQVDAAFFKVFAMRLLAGRGFEAVDSDPQRGTILVNRSFVETVLAGGEALGRTVRVPRGNARYQIVGIVDNQFAYSGEPSIYRPLTAAAHFRQNSAPLSLHVAMRMGPVLPAGFAVRLHQIATALDPSLHVDDIQPLEEIYFFLSLPDYIAGSLPVVVALGVLLFATVGIYTRMSFDIVQRRREIGIRAALGASPLNLVLGIFRSVFVPVSIGVGLGGLTALILDFYLSPSLFGTGANRPLPWILPAAEAFILLIGLLALFGPVRRTLQVDATEALREG